MKKLNLVIVILLALVLALIPLLGACGGGTPSEQEEEEEEEEEELYGGVLKIIGGARPVMNLGFPAGSTIPSDIIYVGQVCLQSLFKVDAQGSIVPNLATAWEFSPDYQSLTITLRQGVKFHDGSVFDAEAVKYNLDLYRAAPKPELMMVQSIDVVDDYTVRLNLSQFDATLLSNLTNGSYASYMISPTAHQTNGDEWCMANPVGTGPFEFVSWDPMVSIKYEKFADYWEEGKPYLDGLEFAFVVDPMVALASFQAGEASAILLESPKNTYDLEQTGEYVINIQPYVTLALAPDSANPDSPFADLRVRQAVAHAIDIEAITDAVSYGYYQATLQPASTDSVGYNPDIAGYPYDPVKAEELLSETDYADGFDTTLIVPIGLPETLSAFTVVQSYLEEIGINAEIEVAGQGPFVQYITMGWENGLIMAHHIGATPAPLGMLLSFYSSVGYAWVSMAHPDDYDAKILQAAVETDDEARNALIQEAMRLSTDEYCLAIPIFIESTCSATTQNVHDLHLRDPSGMAWTPEDAWFSGDKPGWDGDGPPPPPPPELDWSDMPIYAGAEQTEQGTWQLPAAPPGDWTQEELRFYATEDSSSDVASFYQSAMLDNGWEEVMALENFMGMDYILIYNKNSEQDSAEVLIGTHEGNTYICLKRQAK